MTTTLRFEAMAGVPSGQCSVCRAVLAARRSLRDFDERVNGTDRVHCGPAVVLRVPRCVGSRIAKEVTAWTQTRSYSCCCS